MCWSTIVGAEKHATVTRLLLLLPSISSCCLLGLLTPVFCTLAVAAVAVVAAVTVVAVVSESFAVLTAAISTFCLGAILLLEHLLLPPAVAVCNALL